MPSSTRHVAVVDIGSNSIKLLVAAFINGSLHNTIHFETDDTRIGGFLGMESQQMTEEAMRAGVMSVEKLVRVASTFEPAELAIIATSAVREAENRRVFCDWIHEVTGYPVTILSGNQEAEAIALGVRCDPELSNLDEFYMLDQGGGSLEIIHWRASATELISLPLGAVRLFKQFQQSDLGPVTHSVRQAIDQWVDQQWDQVAWLKQITQAPWVGTGGALTLIRSILADRAGDTFENSPSLLSYEALSEFYHQIAPLTVSERMTLAKVPASRADILPAGLIAILRIMERAPVKNLTHSVYNLRYGYAAKLSLRSN